MPSTDGCQLFTHSKHPWHSKSGLGSVFVCVHTANLEHIHAEGNGGASDDDQGGTKRKVWIWHLHQMYNLVSLQPKQHIVFASSMTEGT